MALYPSAEIAYKHRHRFFLIQKGKCPYCQCLMTLDPQKKNVKQAHNYATFEHVVPTSKGGKKYCNIILACMKCNSKRNSKALTNDEFYRTRDILLTIIASNISEYITSNNRNTLKQFLNNIN